MPFLERWIEGLRLLSVLGRGCARVIGRDGIERGHRVLRTTATAVSPVPWAFLRPGIAGALSAVPPELGYSH